ncbi:hypothetical protein [Sodalis-like endosymbiont of Proechinophthirus fluctus]|uniref:hypothetical protein n=1 Tax=Sodalis-like endosymbiont of Proechinophthirus fluctus TaxID=1462730 RepID=UPI000B2C7520|nr:hypothetical protein [Sodalis-like endosymbiont of Proechinophthirus fluctus]
MPALFETRYRHSIRQGDILDNDKREAVLLRDAPASSVKQGAILAKTDKITCPP